MIATLQSKPNRMKPGRKSAEMLWWSYRCSVETERTQLSMGGDHVSFRGLLISNSLLLLQISTSSLWQSNCLQKLETLESFSCTLSYRIKVIMSFVCSIFYEKKPECKFKLKGDSSYYFPWFFFLNHNYGNGPFSGLI